MNYVEYITSSLAKGTIGANISVGIFALIGLCAVLGMYYGAVRGFSKSVIRLFVVGAAAVCAFLCVSAISNVIVTTATGNDGEVETVYQLFTKYFPDYVNAIPNLFKPIMKEIGAETATVFIMMLISVLISPILFIVFFYLFRFLSIFLSELLAGLTGAISFGKGVVSSLLGAAVGCIQGLLIAAVIIIPISGVCDVAMSSREALIENKENPNEYLVQAYDIFDDLQDNPIFELIDKFGGKTVYDDMITVTVNDTKYNMGKECVDAFEILSDLLPIIDPSFNWQHPTDEQKQAFASVVEDIGDDDLIASLTADIMRGFAACIRGNVVDLGLSGASKKLMNDVMEVFTTTTRDTVEGDMKMLVDIYLIMCDRDLIEAYVSGDADRIRDVLTNKDENGVSAVDAILDRLNEYDRAKPIVTSFTKLSISTVMGSMQFDETTEELYQNVKEDITTVLNHNKSDFETEEEYKQAVTEDLDKAFEENNIVVEEEVKQGMVDYIAENFGDHVGEITEDDINEAILSYYKAYTDKKHELENTPELPETPETPEGEEPVPEE